MSSSPPAASAASANRGADAIAPNAWPSGDPLGETLHFLRMTGVFYTRSELTAPWGLVLPPMPDCLMFHVVTAGACWLGD
ncbi:cupin domain-containing protein, partial [Thiohalocapsa halophila]